MIEAAPEVRKSFRQPCSQSPSQAFQDVGGKLTAVLEKSSSYGASEGIAPEGFHASATNCYVCVHACGKKGNQRKEQVSANFVKMHFVRISFKTTRFARAHCWTLCRVKFIEATRDDQWARRKNKTRTSGRSRICIVLWAPC